MRSRPHVDRLVIGFAISRRAAGPTITSDEGHRVSKGVATERRPARVWTARKRVDVAAPVARLMGERASGAGLMSATGSEHAVERCIGCSPGTASRRRRTARSTPTSRLQLPGAGRRSRDRRGVERLALSTTSTGVASRAAQQTITGVCAVAASFDDLARADSRPLRSATVAAREVVRRARSHVVFLMTSLMSDFYEGTGARLSEARGLSNEAYAHDRHQTSQRDLFRATSSDREVFENLCRVLGAHQTVPVCFPHVGRGTFVALGASRMNWVDARSSTRTRASAGVGGHLVRGTPLSRRLRQHRARRSGIAGRPRAAHATSTAAAEADGGVESLTRRQASS